MTWVLIVAFVSAVGLVRIMDRMTPTFDEKAEREREIKSLRSMGLWV